MNLENYHLLPNPCSNELLDKLNVDVFFVRRRRYEFLSNSKFFLKNHNPIRMVALSFSSPTDFSDRVNFSVTWQILMHRNIKIGRLRVNWAFQVQSWLTKKHIKLGPWAKRVKFCCWLILACRLQNFLPMVGSSSHITWMKSWDKLLLPSPTSDLPEKLL